MHWGLDHSKMYKAKGNLYEGFLFVPQKFERYDSEGRGSIYLWVWLQKTEILIREWDTIWKTFLVTESVIINGVRWNRTTSMKSGVIKQKLISTHEQRVAASNQTYGGGGVRI